MLLRISSDLHLEFYEYRNPGHSYRNEITDFSLIEKTETDSEQVLLLAGDICSLYKIDSMSLFFESIANRFKKVIVISGNHEYYKGDINNDVYFREFYNKFGICFLQNESTTIDGVDIYGSTLWTDINNGGIYNKYDVSRGMSDYRVINNGSLRLTVEDTMEINKEHFGGMKIFSSLPSNNKKVCMTHHLPSYKSIATKWKSSQLNCAFASNYDDFIENSNIDLFVHGHTHDSNDYFIGKSRIISNPAGYPERNSLENKEYNKKLIIDI